MRNIIISLVALFLTQPVLSQNKPSKTQKPVKSDMLAGINEAANELNKQIIDLEKQKVEAKKNKEEESTIKDLEDQISMLKKQVAMIGGLGNSISNISEKTFQLAADEGTHSVPKKDVGRINSLPSKVLNDAEVFSFVKNIHADVEKLIPLAEKTGAVTIYNETKARYKTVIEINNAAAGCWIYGHWEKAIWLAGKASMDSMDDPDNLNNYAAFLTMIGGEHAALPILQYLDKKYPGNSTILNNIGQAWFGLGDMVNAKKFLEKATALFIDHSMANLTLGSIYGSEGDSIRAILAIRRSIKNCYTPEKESKLERFGGELDDDDIDFDYPMEEDPLGFEPFFDFFPAVPGNIGETPMARRKWDAFYEATQSLKEQANEEENKAHIRTAAFRNRMADTGYNQPVLKLHNSHVNIKAGRKLQVALRKRTALSIVEVMNMMANAFHEVTTNRLNALEKKRQEDLKHTEGCSGAVAVNNNFMREAKAVIDEGGVAMRTIYMQNKKKIHSFIKLMGYSATNDYNEGMGKFHEEIWKKNQWVLTYTARFAAAYASLKERPAMFSSCEEIEAPTQTLQLPSFKEPKCTHTATLTLPVGGIKEECNTCTIDESRLKFRQNNSQKGEVQISERVNRHYRGPQMWAAPDPPIVIECNKSTLVKIDRKRGNTQKRCTVSSERSSSSYTGSHSPGGKILSR